MAAGGGERDPVTVGPYRLVNRIGEGGMGVVHLALDGQGRAVAVKVLRAHVAGDPDARLRLRREVETLRRVQHPRVAGVLDADVEGALPYLVTQFVPGRSLERLVQEDGPLTTDDVVRLGRALAEALQAIHDVGVVHRDVKPPNVVLVDGEPVLIDFGIAHVAEDSRITVAGLVMGTPGYLSPEVSIGERVAPPTDWWGWGATLSFAATGRNPFGTGPIEVVLDRVRRGEADLAGVPEPVRTALSAALIVDPKHRPPGPQLVGMLTARPSLQLSGPMAAARPTELIGAETSFVVASSPVARTVAHASSPAAATTALGGAPAAPAPSGATPTPAPAARAATTPLMTPPTRAYRPPTASPPPASPPTGSPPAGSPPAGSPPAGAPAPAHNGSARHAPVSPNGYARFHTSPTPAAPPPVRSAAPHAPPSPVASATVPPQPRELRHPDQPPTPSENLARTGVLACLWLTLTAFAAVAPIAAALLATGGIVLARTVDRSLFALWRRRAGTGARTSDLPMTLLALPWRMLLSVLATIPAMLMPLAAGIVTVFVAGLIRNSAGVPLGSQHPVSLAAGMGVALLIAWWGFGGSSVRRGTRQIARALTPGDWGPPIAAGLLVLVVLACVAVASRAEVDWSPLHGPPGVGTGL